jgi:hypothetical protein
MTSFPTWTPRDGDIVHLARNNFWSLPAGRYTLKLWNGVGFELVDHKGPLAVARASLFEAFADGQLTPIDPAELERDRQAMNLRRLAPLRSRRPVPQIDVDGLALFDAHRSPTLEF